MQQYVVGGAVRDALMGIQPKDIDYVWCGVTPQYLISIGMTQVGAAFPVFLDRKGQEHALARTEVKTGIGYYGFECAFDPSVTIEDDLARRDLTINSLAVKIEDWPYFCDHGDISLIIDPYGGIDHISKRLLHHTTQAFQLDPVRVLRTARFAARYRFSIAPETIQLMKHVVPELAVVPQERVWAEFEKGLMEYYPELMIEALEQCGAFDVLKPYKFAPAGIVGLKLAAKSNLGLPIRFATICHGFTLSDFESCRIPSNCADLGRALIRNFDALYLYTMAPISGRLDVLLDLDCIRRPDIADQLCTVLMLSKDDFNNMSQLVAQLVHDLDVVRNVDAGAIALSCTDPKQIKQAVYQARLTAMTR